MSSSILNFFHLSNSRDVVDLSEILDCCPFHQKELDYKLADGEMVNPISENGLLNARILKCNNNLSKNRIFDFPKLT
jgi:hypothetical protein